MYNVATNIVETINTIDPIAQASLRVRGFIDTGYDEGAHLGEILGRGTDTDIEPIVAMRKEEAKLLSEKGDLVTFIEASAERHVVSCPGCDFHSTAKSFNISHYSVEPGSIVTYEWSTGFISSSGKLNIKRIKGIGIEELHRLRELHSPSDRTVQAINSLFE